MRLPPTYYRLRRSNLFLPFSIPFALVAVTLMVLSIHFAENPFEPGFFLLYLVVAGIIGTIAGVIGIVIADIVPRLRWILRVKCTMRQTSIGIVILAFTLGAISWCWPEQQRKFLMPNNHHPRLQAKTYSIWYYPRWNKPIEHHHMLSEFKCTAPAITIKSNSGQFIDIAGLSPDKMGHVCYPCATKIGTVHIPHSGRYELFATSKDDPEFVIALVPPEAEIRNPPFGGPIIFPFEGFSDKHLED